MHLLSRNENPSSVIPQANENNIEVGTYPMKVTAQQEDLQLLSKILQERLRYSVDASEFFQVRCAVKKDQLMILVEHPPEATVNTEAVFKELETVLESLPTHKKQKVELFVRMSGTKFPYAKHSLNLRVEKNWESKTSEISEIIEISIEKQTPETSESQFLSSSDSPSPTPNSPLPTPNSPLPTPNSPLPLLGSFLFIAAAFGAGAFLVTSPCLMFECKEIQTAEALQNSFQQLASNANSEEELVQMQKRLESVTVALKAIPPWSPRHQEAKKLTTDLSGKSEQVSQVVKGFAAANSALQKTQTPANSLEELQLRQEMWRHAITPLETINSNSDLHGLVQQQLSLYRLRLQTVNQLLITEERWLKKLAASKAVANEAIKREAVAKTAEDWQKVLSTWQVVVNALTPIPQTSPSYQEAQKLLAEYQPQLAKVRERSTKQLFAAQTYNQAINAAEQAKSYEQQNQWQAAVTQWQQALTTAQQIRSDNPYYQKAQTLIEPFSISLRQAQAQMQPRTDENKTRTDLEKTCAGDVRICNFILDDKGITVRITPEYEQTLQTSLVNASNTGDGEAVNNVTLHLKVLQEAFEVISENSNLPLLVYDAKGAVIHRRT